MHCCHFLNQRCRQINQTCPLDCLPLCEANQIGLVCQSPKSKLNGRSNQRDLPPNGRRFLITSVIQALVCCLSLPGGYIIHIIQAGKHYAFTWHFVARHCLDGRQWQSLYAMTGLCFNSTEISPRFSMFTITHTRSHISVYSGFKNQADRP